MKNVFKFLSYFINSYKNNKFRKLEKKQRYTSGDFLHKNKKIIFPDAQSFCFTYKELFVKQIYKFLADNEVPVIFDCGANIGLSIIYFKEIYPKAKIVAFEPDKLIFDYLKKNIQTFHLEDITLINKGLWWKETTMTFFNEGSDANRILQNFEENEFESISPIETVKLSSYINENIDFLKIDIEGAETEVLIEVEQKLKFVKHIFIEYHSFKAEKQSLNEILEILSRNSFHYYIESPNKLRNIPFIDNYTFLSMDFFLNIFARKIGD